MPPDGSGNGTPGLLQFMVELGNSIRTKYRDEGGLLAGPVRDLNWPLAQLPEDVAAEINGSRVSGSHEILLPPGKSWGSTDRCPNRLYRGWVKEEGWKAASRDRSDP